jgi:hypothetical protein
VSFSVTTDWLLAVDMAVILNVSVSQTLYPVGATTISFPTSQSTGAFKVRVVVTLNDTVTFRHIDK